MSITDIIEELRELNVGIKLKDGQLVLSNGKDRLSDRLIAEIKDNKNQLIEYIKSYEKQSAGSTKGEQSSEEYYPLTAQQKSIWLASQNPDTEVLYNQPSMFIAKGKLSIYALNYSISKIVKRHESLRSAFYETSNGPRQKVLKDAAVYIDYLELGHQENINDIYKKFSCYVFNLSNPPLFKCLVVKANENEHYLLFNIHHIVSDGWSVNIFFKELLENYSLYLHNGNNEKENIDVSLSFKEYVDYQNSYIESAKGKTDLDFWKGKIKYDYSSTKFSSKTDYEGLDYYSGDYCNYYLPDKIHREINNFCKLRRVTPFHFYSAAFTLLLSRYTGNKTISFGTPFACRSDIKFNIVIACFINTLPVIINSEQAVTFEDLLNSVASEITEVYNHQNYPAEKIVENINLSQANTGSPLFDIIIVYQNYSLNRYTTEELEISYIDTPIEKSKAGLVLRIFEDNNKLIINIEYSKKLFGRSFIEQMFGHYQTVVQNILTNPGARINEIEYIREPDKSELINILNNSGVQYPKDKTVIDYLDEQFKKQNDKVAVIVNGKKLSYTELDRKSNILANYLIDELKICPNKIMGIMTGRNENLIIGIIAILKTGSAYLPINPLYPEYRKKIMLDDSGCKLVLTDDMIENGSYISIPINKILAGKKYSGKELTIKPEISQSNSAYIIYTSGSTGKPKGVVINHKNLLRLFFNDEQIFDFNESDVWTLFHSYSFDLSVWEIFGALLFGGKLVIVSEEITKDPSAYYDLLVKENVTVLNQTPSAFYRLLPDKDKKLLLRYIIFGGEALQPGKLKDWKSFYPVVKMINMYGITETTVHVTYKEITDKDIEAGISNIGKPIPTLGLCVLDENLEMLPKGILGQICVYGEGLSQGYLNQPELTAEKFKNISPFGLCYLSGDLGSILENGDIEYLGRLDDQVQLHGFRIELREIEHALISIEGIKEAVVVAVGNGSEISLNAFIVSEKKRVNDFIRGELANKIPGYMIPSNFVMIDAVPLTPNGKTDNRALMKIKPAGNKKIVRPANEIEEKILEAWKVTLGDIEISTDESFFVIGGDSIKALKLVQEINKKINAGLTIAGLYENNTIIKIAMKAIDNVDTNPEEEIRQELIRIEESSIELIKKNDLAHLIEQILPMSDIQRGMIYYSLKNPGSSIYHDQFIYQIYVKDFSFDIFSKTLELMMNKHQMLRTSFNMIDYNEDVQLIHKYIQPEIQYEDLSEKHKGIIEKTVNDYVLTERRLKFDPANPPLWRMKIFKAPENVIIICWSFHHSLFDGWSSASFSTELLSIYKNIINNSEYKPDLLNGSYLHYIAEQNVIKKNNDIINFWRNELADYKRLELPKNESDTVNSPADVYYLQFDTDLINVLKKLAFNLGTDIKTLFFSAYIYCMGLLTYENDLLVGVVTNNRPVTEDSEKILGCFLNTVPCRITVDSSKTWKEHILSINSKMNIQKKYEGLSLYEIVKNLDASIGDSNPLFDVFFNYVDFNIYENIYADYSLESHGIKEYTLNGYENTNTVFDFYISNTLNKCSLQISYNQENISSKWVKRIGNYYHRLLYLMSEGINEQLDADFQSDIRKVVKDSRIQLKDISLVERTEIELLESYNNAWKKFPENPLTVTNLYNEQLKNNKDKIGVLFDDDLKHVIKYSVYDDNVTKLAYKILGNTINKPRGLIGIVSERNEFFIYAVMAIIKSGNGYVPVDPYFPEERAKYILKDCGCSTILCERKYKDHLLQIFDCEIIVIEEILAENLPDQDIIFPEVSESDPLFLLYTSGSTGKPKGVLMPHKPVVNLFLWMRNKYPVENERILLINPCTFDMSTWGVFGWAMNGSSVCIMKQGNEKDPSKIVNAILEKSITSFHIVPSMLTMVLEYIEKHSVNMTDTKLRYVFVAGEVLQKHLIYKFKKCFEGVKAELVNLYGPTEVHIGTYFNSAELDENKHRTVPIGRPIANTKVLIVDKEMRVVPPGILGEILLGGECLSDGYLNKPALTKEKYIILENELTRGRERFYRTGDIGRWLSDGNIEFHGRNDFQIKIRGFRVEPDEVQSIINKINGVKESLVIVSEIIPGDKRLVAYIVYEEKDKYDEDSIRNELKKQAADYMVPSVFIGMDKFPLNPNGKIDRKSLPEPQLSHQRKSIITPRNKLEKRITEIWSEILKVDNIGVNDNFFDIGGHSLLMIRLQSELEKETNKKFEVVDLFRYPTIALLSEFIKEESNNNTVIDKAIERAENQKNARERRMANSKRKGRANE